MKEKNNKNGIEYVLVGDYYIPQLNLDQEGYKPYSQLGKYARMRFNYLREFDKITYQIMFIDGVLYKHLQEIQDIATNRVNKLVEKLAKKENVTEELKTTNQLAWVGAMNNIKNRVEEIVLQEVVYGKEQFI